MALTKDKVRSVLTPVKTTSRSFLLASGVELYEGALVGVRTDGYVTEASSSIEFAGVARAHAKNTSATAVATDIYVDCDYGHIERFSNTNAAVSQINDKVYAHADDTISVTSATSGIAEVGKIVKVDAGKSYDVIIRGDMS